MLASTFAQVDLVASLDWVLSEIPVGEALEVHQGHLGTRNLHIREGVNDVRNKTYSKEREKPGSHVVMIANIIGHAMAHIGHTKPPPSPQCVSVPN